MNLLRQLQHLAIVVPHPQPNHCAAVLFQRVLCMQMKLQPLHEFIHTLGPMPPLAHLHTYVSRMKEQGWNVWRIVKKALETGHLQADLCAMLQMPVCPPPPSVMARIQCFVSEHAFHSWQCKAALIKIRLWAHQCLMKTVPLKSP